MTPPISGEKVTIKTHISPEDSAVFLYPTLAAVQLCLTVYSLVRFRRLTLEQRKKPKAIHFVSPPDPWFINHPLRPVLERGPRIHFDPPGLWQCSIMIASLSETAISFGCTTALALVGDAFLVWRAAVVWSHKPILKWFPILLYICSFAVSLASSFFQWRALHVILANSASNSTALGPVQQDNMENSDPHHIAHVRATYQLWRFADFSMSVAVSVATTTLIIARLLLLQRRLKNLSENSVALTSTLPYRQIIALVLESALPFTLVGVIGAVATVFIDPEGKRHKWALDSFPILLVLWTNALALGPQFIAFRIICGTTWTSNPSTNHTRPVSQPLLFADDPVVSILANHSDDEFELKEHEGSLPTGLSSDSGLRPRRVPTNQTAV
ncbi:hypothetical protein BKA70DRAFT_1568025 [Coprinopsis sp. MPI-PUGE-AT-0042]|nr:hypothetical protein BKA70DRAFT_1568025 [Coprinopsis sp. MPI-PUGE-AT-0042]